MTEHVAGETVGREEVIFLHAAVSMWRRLSTSAMMPIKGVLRSCDLGLFKNNKTKGGREEGREGGRAGGEIG